MFMKQSIVMKHIQTFVSAAICGFVLTLAGIVCAQDNQPGVATVVSIVGEARYSLGDGVWHPLMAGKILTAGAVIQTGHDSTVDIVLGKKIPKLVLGKAILMSQANTLPGGVSLAADANVRGYVSYRPLAVQNAVRMTGDTVLAIDKLYVSDTGVDTVSDTELDLRQGGIYCSVNKLSGTSQYLIKIPNGIAGVRGTLFHLGDTGECIAYKNSVVLSIINAMGTPETVVVSEGTRFNPKTGKVSSLPPGLGTELNQIFAALRTLYFPDAGQDIHFIFDRTESPISPTTGNFR
jgi:hypothetical protein